MTIAAAIRVVVSAFLNIDDFLLLLAAPSEYRKRARRNTSKITPGQYKAFSWEGANQGEWQYSDFMDLYEDRGQPIRIDGGRRDPISVQLIPPRI